MARLRAVFFDAFGTLLDPGGLHVEATALILSELGLAGQLDPEELHERWDEHIMALWRDGRFMGTWELFRTALEAALGDLGVEVPARELDVSTDILSKTFLRTRLHEGARELLAFCRSLGLRTGIISDADSALLRSLLEKHGLLPLLDVVIISDEVGLLKPDPRVFDAALRAIGCGAEEAMMVGDAERDVEGARRAGMRAVLVLRADRRLPELSIEPDIIVGSLAELRGPIAALAEEHGLAKRHLPAGLRRCPCGPL